VSSCSIQVGVGCGTLVRGGSHGIDTEDEGAAWGKAAESRAEGQATVVRACKGAEDRRVSGFLIIALVRRSADPNGGQVCRGQRVKRAGCAAGLEG